MILDFKNIEGVKLQVQSSLNKDSAIPEWEKEIFNFLHWYFFEETPLLQKTSGSTGAPKEIQLKRELLKSSAEATIQFFNLSKGSTALLCIPAKFIGGKMMLLRAIIGEWKLTCLEPKADLTLALVNKPSFSFSAMIPLQVQKLFVNNLAIISEMKNLIIGGAPVSIELENLLCNAALNAYSTYGMTETASHVALKKLDCKSHFHALDGISFKTDEENRLIIQGARVPQSPLLTNDVVELISTSSFIWLGRFDNVINSGGVKIVAEELEKIIATLVKYQFYVKKEQHLELGETPVLVIESLPWEPENTASLLDKIKKKSPDFWAPKCIVFKELFERTESGKIIRN